MAQDFKSVMSELWAKLKLGAPEFGPTYALTLSIDGFDIGLNESADGRNVVVTGVIGRLAPDAYRREEQVRKLLKISGIAYARAAMATSPRHCCRPAQSPWRA